MVSVLAFLLAVVLLFFIERDGRRSTKAWEKAATDAEEVVRLLEKAATAWEDVARRRSRTNDQL